jgi:hypothetical protein
MRQRSMQLQVVCLNVRLLVRLLELKVPFRPSSQLNTAWTISAPHASIEVVQSGFTTFLNSITFGIFHMKNTNITYSATDSMSGVKQMSTFVVNADEDTCKPHRVNWCC